MIIQVGNYVIYGILKYEYDKYKINLHTFAETKFK